MILRYSDPWWKPAGRLNASTRDDRTNSCAGKSTRMEPFLVSFQQAIFDDTRGYIKLNPIISNLSPLKCYWWCTTLLQFRSWRKWIGIWKSPPSRAAGACRAGMLNQDLTAGDVALGSMVQNASKCTVLSFEHHKTMKKFQKRHLFEAKCLNWWFWRGWTNSVFGWFVDGATQTFNSFSTIWSLMW